MDSALIFHSFDGHGQRTQLFWHNASCVEHCGNIPFFRVGIFKFLEEHFSHPILKLKPMRLYLRHLALGQSDLVNRLLTS